MHIHTFISRTICWLFNGAARQPLQTCGFSPWFRVSFIGQDDNLSIACSDCFHVWSEIGHLNNAITTSLYSNAPNFSKQQIAGRQTWSGNVRFKCVAVFFPSNTFGRLCTESHNIAQGQLNSNQRKPETFHRHTAISCHSYFLRGNQLRQLIINYVNKTVCAHGDPLWGRQKVHINASSMCFVRARVFLSIRLKLMSAIGAWFIVCTDIRSHEIRIIDNWQATFEWKIYLSDVDVRDRVEGKYCTGSRKCV